MASRTAGSTWNARHGETVHRPRLSRAVLVVLLGGVACWAPPQAGPGAEWPRATLAEQGIDPAPIEQFTARARAGDFGHVNRIVVVRQGALVVDETIERDYREISRGHASGIGCGVDACADTTQLHAYNYLHPDFHPWGPGGRSHTLQSVTKPIAATVLGVAIARGEIPGVGAPLLSFFDAYDTSRLDPRLARATLQDLLTMRLGIEWHETDRPLDSTNTTLQLERSDDWIRFTLAQPMDADPGEKWVYNSGGSQLMSEIIRSATGEHIDRYAERYLFGPLGILEYHWKQTPTGHPDTEGGLFLGARDLARIGQLYLDDGVWNGERLLPPGWAREATSRHVERVAESDNAPAFGYQWWIHEHRGAEIWTGRGFGGQLLLVIPGARIVGVINSWNVFGERVTGVLVPFVDALLDGEPSVLSSVDADSLAMAVTFPPAAVPIAGRRQHVYELHLTNLASSPAEILHLEITDAESGRSLAAFGGADLANRISAAAEVAAAPGVLEGGAAATVFIELETLPGARLVALEHRVSLSRGSATSTGVAVGARVSMSGEEPVELGPPLVGGPWAALYHPSWRRGHRRVYYVEEGRSRIPGRFAIDFFRINGGGQIAAGDRDGVSNWFGHGAAVLAVADADVVAARDDLAESETLAGYIRPPLADGTGNYVALDLGQGRYAFYEHLQPGSVRVRVGQRVARGDTIAAVGFTGHTSGPHLHFHVANANSPLGAEGIPFVLTEFAVMDTIGTDPGPLLAGRWTPRLAATPERRTRERPAPNTVIRFPGG